MLVGMTRAWGRREVEARAVARAVEGPHARASGPGNAARLRMLQRTGGRGVEGLGNAAALRRVAPVQALAEVGRQDDRFEREAHAVADAIVARPGPAAGEAPKIQRIADPGAVGLRGVPAAVDAEIAGARGRGSSLPGELASTVGSRLGADLGGVRVHTDARADRLNRALGARAFTSGRDIFFRRGAYEPGGGLGRRVLVHELTHVVQQGGAGGARPPIQRFVMQVGNDDGYTSTMTRQLREQHEGEGLLQFSATWDENFFGVAAGPYAPKAWHSPKGTGKVPTYGPSLKLKSVPSGEPLRIVGHGNIRGEVGGYSGAEMAALIERLGLPKEHDAGVDVHGCLPASNWTDPKTGALKPAHIVALEDSLSVRGYSEVVRGYEHCIFPDIESEVASAAYGFFEIARAMNNMEKGASHTLTAAETAKVRSVLGDEADAFLADVAPGGTVTNGLYFMWEAKKLLRDKGLMQSAKLIDTSQARAELRRP